MKTGRGPWGFFGGQYCSENVQRGMTYFWALLYFYQQVIRGGGRFRPPPLYLTPSVCSYEHDPPFTSAQKDVSVIFAKLFFHQRFYKTFLSFLFLFSNFVFCSAFSQATTKSGNIRSFFWLHFFCPVRLLCFCIEQKNWLNFITKMVSNQPQTLFYF